MTVWSGGVVQSCFFVWFFLSLNHIPSDQAGDLSSVPKTSSGLGEDQGQKFALKLSVKVYPLARQVSALLRLSHGERYSVIESLRRSLRRELKSAFPTS